MPIHHIQPTFAGGEFAPSLYARIDLAKYATGLRTARNMFIHPHGGASNRPGTKYVNTVKDSTKKTRLIPFEFSTTQAYVIEAGAGYFRFFKDHGAVLATAANGVGAYDASRNYVAGDFVMESTTAYECILAGTGHLPSTSPTYWTPTPIYEVLSPYDEADLVDLKYTQSADVLYIFHPDYAIRKLTRTDHAAWTLTTLDFKNGPFMPSNIITTLTMAASATTGTNKTLTASSSYFVSGHIGGLFRLIHTIPAQSETTDFNGTGTSTGIKCGGTWRIMSHGTWTGTIKVEKSIDGGTNWTELRAFTSKDNFNINTYGEDEEYCLVRLNCTDFMATPTGTLAYNAATNYDLSTTEKSWCTSGGVLYMALVPNTGHDPATSPGFWQAKTARVELSSDPFEQTGIVKVKSITSGTVAVVDILTEVGLTSATSDWAEGSWSTYRGFPTCGIFYQDRFAVAASVSEPQTIWFSKVASYEDFGRSTPLVDSDGISVNLPSRKMNGINNLVGLGEIVAFTSSSEWSVGPGTSGILTPTSVETKLQGNRGSSAVDPMSIGSRVIFCQPMDSVVADLGYDYNAKGYTSEELSIISNHLFQGYTIKEMAYQQEPDSLLWLVRSDGALLSLTYMREQEVLAWTRHDTGEVTDVSGNITFDSFEAICCIPGVGYNEVWVIVKRGSTRFVEYFTHRMGSSAVEDQYFMDCGYTYDSTPATSLTGLSWLIGKDVTILADGNVAYDTVDASGNITVTPAASVISVGLPYVSDLETLNVDLTLPDGTSQDRTMQVGQLTVRFDKSRGGWIGSDSAHLDQIFQRSTEAYGDPIALQSYDYQAPINGAFDSKGRVFVRQIDPLPMSILAVMPQITMGD